MSVHTHIFKSRKNGYVALSLLQLLQKFRYTIIFSISLFFTPLAGRSLSTEHARRHHQPGRVKQADRDGHNYHQERKTDQVQLCSGKGPPEIYKYNCDSYPKNLKIGAETRWNFYF